MRIYFNEHGSANGYQVLATSLKGVVVGLAL